MFILTRSVAAVVIAALLPAGAIAQQQSFTNGTMRGAAGLNNTRPQQSSTNDGTMRGAAGLKNGWRN